MLILLPPSLSSAGKLFLSSTNERVDSAVFLFCMCVSQLSTWTARDANSAGRVFAERDLAADSVSVDSVSP